MKFNRLTTAIAAGVFMSVAGVAQAASHAATELVIATLNNGHMIEMQKHTKVFEEANPGITVKWVTLEESVLRQRVTTDIATKGGQFDIMTIGMYETPAVAAMHSPDDGVYGICLRGKPGWGDNMAFLSTLANTFGAKWFDENWKPQLDSPEWKAAVTFYVDLMKK